MTDELKPIQTLHHGVRARTKKTRQGMLVICFQSYRVEILDVHDIESRVNGRRGRLRLLRLRVDGRQNGSSGGFRARSLAGDANLFLRHGDD